MINERYREDRERRRLGSLTVYSGPTHSGKTKKLDDGVCAQPGCRNLASRTQRFHVVNGTPERFLPVCRRHHTAEPRAQMFQEIWFDEPSGSLDLISGCMFSGKTQELIRRLDQARYAGFTVQAFKPALDDRYAIEAVASHPEIRFPAIAGPHVAAVRAPGPDGTRGVGGDEAQF